MYKILHLEDSTYDAEIISAALTDADLPFSLDLVKNEEKYIEALNKNTYDVILIDNALPNYDSFKAYAYLQKIDSNAVAILVSGTLSGEKAIKLIKDGVHDWVQKSDLALLAAKIEEAATRQKIKHDLHLEDRLKTEKLERYDFALGNSSTGLWDWPDTQKDEMWWSPQIYELIGYPPKDIEATLSNWKDLIVPEDLQLFMKALEGGSVFDCRYRLQSKGEQIITVHSRGSIKHDANGKTTRVAAFVYKSLA